MNPYTQRFSIMALVMLTVVCIGGVLIGLAPLHFMIILMIGYFSIIASPAKLFGQTEKRMPTPLELARYPLIWALIFALAVTVVVFALSRGAGLRASLPLITQSFFTVAVFAGAIGVIAFPLFVRLNIPR